MAKEEADGLDVWDVALLLGGGALGAVGGHKFARALMSKKFLEKARAAKGAYLKSRDPSNRNKKLDREAAPYREYLQRVVPTAKGGALLGGGGAVVAKRSDERKRK